MFNYDVKEKNNEPKNEPLMPSAIMVEGRLSGVSKFRQELDQEYDLQLKEKNKIKNELTDVRKALTQDDAEGDFYVECFPKYNEDDFQASIKDNLSKRPPSGAGAGSKNFRGKPQGQRTRPPKPTTKK